MLTIGLLGGIASGKSTVAKLLAEQGAAVFDADRFAHQVLEQDEVQQQLVQRWGPDVRKQSGGLDRRKIAECVFGDSPQAAEDREFLENLVHPRVRKMLYEALERHAQAGGRVAVLDIPLLIEAGWADDCDVLLLVASDHHSRLDRAAARGWDAAELAQREAAQLPIEEKRLRAHAVVDNTGDLAFLRQEVSRFWEEWIAPCLASSPPTKGDHGEPT